MKELSIEEKAKAYDNIIEKANKMNSENCEACQMCIEELIPELKESEDERIRKKMIALFKGQIPFTSAEDNKKFVAWLEEQGEPVEINPTEFDTRLQALIGKFDSLPKEELANSLSFYLNVVQNGGTYVEEKQDEQNPATDKVEPKFHEGEWVILTAGELSTMLQIVKVDTNKRLYWFNDGRYLPIVDEECLHLWSEDDERMIDTIISDLERHGGKENSCYSAEINYLKSIKDIARPKQEWSEEDESYLSHVFTAVKAYYTDDKGLENPWREELLRWFKSLKERCIWKPGEEHIHWLKWAISRMPDTEKANEAEAVLEDLLEQLKKL